MPVPLVAAAGAGARLAAPVAVGFAPRIARAVAGFVGRVTSRRAYNASAIARTTAIPRHAARGATGAARGNALLAAGVGGGGYLLGRSRAITEVAGRAAGGVAGGVVHLATSLIQGILGLIPNQVKLLALVAGVVYLWARWRAR